MSADFPLHIVPDGQQIWVVRADGGVFAPHFRKAGTIAIGHLNPLELPASQAPYNPAPKSLENALVAKYRELNFSQAQITSYLNQVMRFLGDMKIGDLVVTPGEDGSVSFGRIVGHPRISIDDITNVSAWTGQETTMDFALRRAVAWGPYIRRGVLPVAVTRSLRANQTVFNITDHWRAIHHLIYPFFYKDGELYFSIRLNQEKDIPAYALSKLTDFLVRTEVFARVCASGVDVGGFDFDKIFKELVGEITLSMQAQFFSDGDTNYKVGTSSIEVNGVKAQIAKGSPLERAVVVLVLVSALSLAGVAASSVLYGNDVIGTKPLPFIGTPDKQQTQVLEKVSLAVGGFVQEQWASAGGPGIDQQLKLSVPDFGATAPLTSAAKDEQPLAMLSLPIPPKP